MAENGNQRVTNAILLTKLDGLTDIVRQHHAETSKYREEIAERLVSLATDVTGLKVACAQHDIKITRNEGEIESAKRKGLMWDTINSLGALGAFVGAFIMERLNGR